MEFWTDLSIEAFPLHLLATTLYARASAIQAKDGKYETLHYP